MRRRDRSRRGLRSRVGHALARRAWLAGHRGRLLDDRAGPRPVDGREPGGGRRRAHRLGRGRPCELDATGRPLRPRGLPVRARRGVGGGDGPADGDRGRAGRDALPRRPSPDRPGHRSRDGRGRSGAGVRLTPCCRARLGPLGRHRRRGPSARHGRHGRRCGDPRAAPIMTPGRLDRRRLIQSAGRIVQR